MMHGTYSVKFIGFIFTWVEDKYLLPQKHSWMLIPQKNINNELFHSKFRVYYQAKWLQNINVRGFNIGEISESCFHQTELDYNTCISKRLHDAVQSSFQFRTNIETRNDAVLALLFTVVLREISCMRLHNQLQIIHSQWSRWGVCFTNATHAECMKTDVMRKSDAIGNAASHIRVFAVTLNQSLISVNGSQIKHSVIAMCWTTEKQFAKLNVFQRAVKRNWQPLSWYHSSEIQSWLKGYWHFITLSG